MDTLYIHMFSNRPSVTLDDETPSTQKEKIVLKIQRRRKKRT
jgi:hypothetical protein